MTSSRFPWWRAGLGCALTIMLAVMLALPSLVRADASLPGKPGGTPATWRARCTERLERERAALLATPRFAGSNPGAATFSVGAGGELSMSWSVRLVGGDELSVSVSVTPLGRPDGKASNLWVRFPAYVVFMGARIRLEKHSVRADARIDLYDRAAVAIDAAFEKRWRDAADACLP